MNTPLPGWARQLVEQYESEAAGQFILYGNVNDRYLLPLGDKPELGSLTDFLLRVLLPRFNVVLSYDVGHGIGVLKGREVFSQWPRLRENPELPKEPRAAVETLTQYFRYAANLAQMGKPRIQIGCLMMTADLAAPATQGWFNYDLSAVGTLIRDWSQDYLLSNHGLATFLITENLNDLHPLLANNPRSAQIRLPLPSPAELTGALQFMAPAFPVALHGFQNRLNEAAAGLAGTTLNAVESMLKTLEHLQQELTPKDLMRLKKDMVERECNGLVEFIESGRTLTDFRGNEKVKAWLAQDIVLWRKNDVGGLPKGYLLCGPVGTGKTFLVECLAGEAETPIVKMKNFRDKWVGSTEGNLEKIFRLIRALGRCYVFIDEADQAMGRREASGNDSGLSGRIYSMIAEEMGNADSRGKVIWILASSRPDQIEVDLKRPGRIDVKIPLFPTLEPEEGFVLLQFLCRRRDVEIPDSALERFRNQIPPLLTPGAAEAVAVKAYRLVQCEGLSPQDALAACLRDYQNPVSKEVLEFQIQLAVEEATDREFVPPVFRRQR